jgi:hypothetical protein
MMGKLIIVQQCSNKNDALGVKTGGLFFYPFFEADVSHR